MDFSSSPSYPEGVVSFLDTDLYKLTMQCAVLKYFPTVQVTYAFNNRTPDKKLSRKAFNWLSLQINKLGFISLKDDEANWLQSTCPYLTTEYLKYLKDFHLNPVRQVLTSFTPDNDTGSDDDIGLFTLNVKGLWVETILYEIPLLALTSEAYFKFMDTNWSYSGQEEKAFQKGIQLLAGGCTVSEFGTRRRRDYHTQALVLKGLGRATEEGSRLKLPGKISGTSNVHLAKRFGLLPIGTVAHEWFMGVAAITNDYENATEKALQYWMGCFGEGVLAIALTDTFGTPAFLEAFAKPVMPLDTSSPSTTTATTLDSTKPIHTYAHAFNGVRQDSGDPATFVNTMSKFYSSTGITTPKTIVFSDSLDINLCLQYKSLCDAAGMTPSFGVGTFLTNDFIDTKTGLKSVPLNIVIKISSADGRPAVKISDNIGKNTGDKDVIEEVKRVLRYEEREWVGGDETMRWGTGREP